MKYSHWFDHGREFAQPYVYRYFYAKTDATSTLDQSNSFYLTLFSIEEELYRSYSEQYYSYFEKKCPATQPGKNRRKKQMFSRNAIYMKQIKLQGSHWESMIGDLCTCCPYCWQSRMSSPTSLPTKTIYCSLPTWDLHLLRLTMVGSVRVFQQWKSGAESHFWDQSNVSSLETYIVRIWAV